ncbi:glycosyltransferase family 2 protein [Nonomuraea rhizosphaerae]|uniref:glycosyltransferase family 2 protein n=1 Tax=Nonomuraea rhizosphaerae TaxID=2665663 RepID=UPI001C5D80AB|nr:hypothetical protein [Nonomuraea rhizosphaerae]
MSETVTVWPTVESIPVSAVTDGPPGRLGPVRSAEQAGAEQVAGAGQVAGTVGTGRDTAGGAETPQGAVDDAAGSGTGPGPKTPARIATGVGTAGAKSPNAGARPNPAADLGFSGDPEQHGDPGDDMLHAQRVWDASLAVNRLDDVGVTTERERVLNADITASVSLVVDGWPQDVRACVESVIEHTDVPILAIDLGNVDGAGDVLHELAQRHPERIKEWRVAETPVWRGGTATWGAARAKLLRLDTSEVHVLMDTSTLLEGDALTPLVACVREGAVAAGRQSADRDPAVQDESGQAPARIGALRGDLMAVRRSAAIGALPEDAGTAQDGTLGLSRALHGDLAVPTDRLPVRTLRGPDTSSV